MGRLLIGFEDNEVDGWCAVTTDRCGSWVFVFEVLMLYDAMILNIKMLLPLCLPSHRARAFPVFRVAIPVIWRFCGTSV
jgi:hypothetical protein